MTVVLVGGTTATARIDGISAAGADPEVMAATPTADAELLVAGEPVEAPAVPVSPQGCPTPALVTRAVRDLVGFDVRVVDAGLAIEPGVETTAVADGPGDDIRGAEAVPDARAIWERAADLGADLPAESLLVGESIPGGTTTALGVARALGLDLQVSSSLPDNPTERKRAVVREGLDASGIEASGLAGDPHAAVRRQGDPVLAAVAGLVEGALGAGTGVTLAGGTQMLAVAGLLRHAGLDAPLAVATTRYVAADPSSNVRAVADDLGVSLTVTDPGFGGCDHDGLRRFAAGEGKEGVGMGGALALSRERGVGLAAVRDRARNLYDRLLGGA